MPSFCKFDLLSLPFLPFFLKPFLRRLPAKRQRLPELHVICTWTGDVIKPLLPVSGHQQGAVALAQCPSTFQVTIESRTSVCPLGLVLSTLLLFTKTSLSLYCIYTGSFYYYCYQDPNTGTGCLWNLWTFGSFLESIQVLHMMGFTLNILTGSKQIFNNHQLVFSKFFFLFAKSAAHALQRERCVICINLTLVIEKVVRGKQLVVLHQHLYSVRVGKCCSKNPIKALALPGCSYFPLRN